MLHLSITRQEAESITSSDRTINHYSTEALIAKIKTQAREYLSSL